MSLQGRQIANSTTGAIRAISTIHSVYSICTICAGRAIRAGCSVTSVATCHR
jgi:hypothetical protein